MLMRQYHTDRLGHALGQQAEERTRQIRCLPANVVGVGVTVVDEVPLRLAQFMASPPVERDPLRRHLLTLLAHLLALARGECIEKVLKVPVTAVVPVILAAQPLQPILSSPQQFIAGRLGEIDMHTGKPFLMHTDAQCVDQADAGLAVTKQTSATNR